MSASSKSVNSTLNKCNNNTVTKLRRLKIEENLLVQSLQKHDRKRYHEESKILEIEITYNLDYKNMLKNLIDSYINVKNLFDDLRTVTNSQELLAELELQEIKNKVLELENTLKAYKGYIDRELNSLQVDEKDLVKKLEEMDQKVTKMTKTKTKVSSVNYNQVVPSPVRLMMTSPLKCTAVQDFQDFMKNSRNRYGGWNEYHHNIFVKLWQKHFGNSTDTDFNDSLVETLDFENFIEETLFKIQGVQREHLISHIDWYKKYLFHKQKQQEAIDRWKTNKMSIRNADKVFGNNKENKKLINSLNSSKVDNVSDDFNQIACSYFRIKEEEPRYSDIKKSGKLQCSEIRQIKPLRKIIGQGDIEQHMKPTKQWLNRNYYEEPTNQQNIFVENIKKLCIPTWRRYL